MEFLRRSWAQIRVMFAELPPTSRWLIASLTVILVMAGWVVLQYAAKPELVVMSQFAGEKQPEAFERLRTRGIRVVNEGGQIKVPAEQQMEALVILQEGEFLGPDTSAAFAQLVASQNPWINNQQMSQRYLIALQTTLRSIIGKMTGVKSADVVISKPDKLGFGQTHTTPSASVMVVMQASKGMNQRLVESIARMVSSAVAGMAPADVTVVDANTGRSYKQNDPDDVAANDQIEQNRSQEMTYLNRVREVLSYIPGVIVAVNVQIDTVVAKTKESTVWEDSEPLRSKSEKETESRNMSAGGEPGPRANTGATIDGGSGVTSVKKESESKSEFGEKRATSRTVEKITGRKPLKVNVTVNVPRSFFVSVYKNSQGPDAKDPDEATLGTVITGYLQQIEAQIKPLIETESAGIVQVSQFPDMLPPMMAGAFPGSGSSGGGSVMTLVDAGWAKPIGLGILALCSLAMMFNMVRRATHKPKLPSIQELAGVPSTLPSDDDEFVGEAEAADGGMMGMEIGEGDVQSRKIAEQISDMIKGNTNEASSIFNRWIRKEE